MSRKMKFYFFAWNILKLALKYIAHNMRLSVLHMFCRILEGVREKKSRGNTIIRRLLQGIWLHVQRKDGSNFSPTTSPKKPSQP